MAALVQPLVLSWPFTVHHQFTPKKLKYILLIGLWFTRLTIIGIWLDSDVSPWPWPKIQGQNIGGLQCSP